MRLQFLLLPSALDLCFFHPCLQLLLLFLFLRDQLFVGNAHRLNYGLSVLEVLAVLQHHLPLFEHQGVYLLPRLL